MRANLLSKVVDLCVQGFDICSTTVWTSRQHILLLGLRLLSDSVLVQLLA